MFEREKAVERAVTRGEERRLAPPRAANAVQRRLVVGSSDDPAERDADRIADDVTAMLLVPSGVTGRAATSGRIRRSTVSGPGGGALNNDTTRVVSAATGSAAPSGRIRRSTVIGPEGGALDSDMTRAVSAARTGGSRIRPAVERSLSAAMGADLGGVRLHAGRRAAELNERMQASAFTIGNDVFFRDGLPDASTRDGMHMLTHEVAHTVQQGSSPVRRQVIRRVLIPKARDAFNAAEATNGAFATGRQDTDDLAAAKDQEDLTRVHGRGYDGTDTTDQRKVAHFVRAVVLSEYSSRLRELDDDTTTTDAEKAGRKTKYKAKAEEFRKKHIPLVAKGSTAPDTMAFLNDFGFASAFTASAGGIRSPQQARIDVRSTFIGAPILGMRMRSHLLIVYTSTDGREMYFRGGPDGNGMTVAEMGDYVPGTVDWDPSAHSVTLLEGQAAEVVLDRLIEATSVIDDMQVPYKAVIGKRYGGDDPNSVQWAAKQASKATSEEGENCNSTAWTILMRAGIAPAKPSGHHPGWGALLGARTAGKQNALPPAEATSPGVPYVLDESRDVTDAHGLITVYADRAFLQPLTKVGSGTKVTMYGDDPDWRRIMIGGDLGYVARWTEDAVFDLLPGWARALRAAYAAADIQKLVANPANASLVQAAGTAAGIPDRYVATAAKLALGDDKGQAQQMVQYRLELLGEARAREVIAKPDELTRIAMLLHADPKDVAEAATPMVEEIERKRKIPSELVKVLNDPNAVNLAANEAPGYESIAAVATILRATPTWVVRNLEEFRPSVNQGNRLEDLLAADATATGKLPDVDATTLAEWAGLTGVPARYLDQRCRLIHAERQRAAAKAKAEADARAEADRQARAAAKALADAEAKARAKRRAAAKAQKSQKDALQAIYSGLMGEFMLDTGQIWRYANQLPDYPKLANFAARHRVALDDVLLVATTKCPRPSGKKLLAEVLKPIDPDTLRPLAENPNDRANLMRLIELRNQTGVSAMDISERIKALLAQSDT